MLLQDDRQRYSAGKIVETVIEFAKSMKRSKGSGREVVESDILERGIITPTEALAMLNNKINPQEVKKVLQASGYSSKDSNELVRRWMQEEVEKGLSPKEIAALEQKRKTYQKEKAQQKEREKDMRPMTKEEEEKALDDLMDQFSEGGRVQAAEGFPDLTGDGKTTYADVLKGRGVFNEGGDVDEQMSMLMGPQEELPETEMESEMEMEMESDSEMEDNYLDFIIDEALSEEEEDMLMSKLEQDEELSMLFDKVIEVASEFAGSGPVEGPGTGVSDSIPARLSDGEFVFTAKAVEEIGADNLMAMMKDAEMKADERQGMANGGEMEEEETVVVKGDEPVKQEIRVVKETVNPLKGIEDSNEIGQAINEQMLLDPDQKHVRS